MRLGSCLREIPDCRMTVAGGIVIGAAFVCLHVPLSSVCLAGPATHRSRWGHAHGRPGAPCRSLRLRCTRLSEEARSAVQHVHDRSVL